MSEEKKARNGIDDFLEYYCNPKNAGEFRDILSAHIAKSINALNNKIKSMQLEIDKLKAPKVSVDESDSDSDELDNKPEHCCQIS